MKKIELNERERVFVLRGIQDCIYKQKQGLAACVLEISGMNPVHPKVIQEYHDDIKLLEELYLRVAAS